MSRLVKKKKEDIGLSPFALIFRGQQKIDKVKLHLFDFSKENVTELELESLEKLTEYRDAATTSWINVDGLHNAKFMQVLADVFKLESNVLSDVMNPSIRPKVMEIDQGIFVSMKMLQYQEASNQISVENLSLVFGQNKLISFQEQEGDVFEPVRERIRKHKNKIRTAGSDYLAFALLDIVVDNYIYIIGQLADKIELLEDDMTSSPDKSLLDKINLYKREMNFIRKNIKPAKEMILNLAKMDTDFIQDENRVHFKELQENITEATELADSYREILYDQLNIYHTTMSTKLNETMRVLTIFSVIFIPLTFIVGIYGTNFDYLPELHWKNGYFIMWAFMILLSVLMLMFFRRRKWF